MTPPLARLVDLLGSSLQAYLSAARVWTFPGEEAVKLALVDLAEDERSILDRARQGLEERGQEVPRPAFPIHFTGLHDVDLGALLPRVIEGLRRQVADLERIVAEGRDELAIDLAREARECAVQHADALEDIRRRRATESAAAPAR